MTDANGATWTVTGQTEETGLNDAGMYVPGVKVANVEIANTVEIQKRENSGGTPSSCA